MSLLFAQPVMPKQLVEAPKPEAGGDCPTSHGARGDQVRAGGAHHPTDQGHCGEVLREHLRPNMLRAAQLLPASAAGYFAGKAFELARELEVFPVPDKDGVRLPLRRISNQPELPGQES